MLVIAKICQYSIGYIGNYVTSCYSISFAKFYGLLTLISIYVYVCIKTSFCKNTVKNI